jgi:hypothetical protein
VQVILLVICCFNTQSKKHVGDSLFSYTAFEVQSILATLRQAQVYSYKQVLLLFTKVESLFKVCNHELVIPIICNELSSLPRLTDDDSAY